MFVYGAHTRVDLLCTVPSNHAYHAYSLWIRES